MVWYLEPEVVVEQRAVVHHPAALRKAVATLVEVVWEAVIMAVEWERAVVVAEELVVDLEGVMVVVLLVVAAVMEVDLGAAMAVVLVEVMVVVLEVALEVMVVVKEVALEVVMAEGLVVLEEEALQEA